MRIAIIALLAVAAARCRAAARSWSSARAAATGVVVAQDRRTVGTMTEDEGIEIKAAGPHRRALQGRHPRQRDELQPHGAAHRRSARRGDHGARSERIARGVENVRGVYNELAVAGVSSFTARSNDSIITSKVKARFVDAQKFNALHVKVVTENSVVYLLGLVKKQEADDATEIARTTSGVQKVVQGVRVHRLNP